MTEPQPVIIVDPPKPNGFVHPDAPEGYPTPGHKMDAEADPEVEIDHLGRIDQLATELRGATPSGADTISNKIKSHIRALRDPEADKRRRVFDRDMKVERAKEQAALSNPDRGAGLKEAEASRERQIKLQQEYSDRKPSKPAETQQAVTQEDLQSTNRQEPVRQTEQVMA